MDSPLHDIKHVINAVAGSPSPDAQIAAIEHYFAHDAAFSYPIFAIPRAPGSRNRIIGTYLFYRNAVRSVRYEFLSIAFDEKAGRVFVELNQWPNFLGLRTLIGDWRVRLHMFAVLCMSSVPLGIEGADDV